MSLKNMEISVSKTSPLASKMEDFTHFALCFCWNGSRCSFICDQLSVLSLLVCCGRALGQCQRWVIMVKGKADYLIGTRVAPHTSLKGRNLTPEETHWHHLSFMWRPQWSKVIYFWLFNTIIEPLGFFSLLVFNYFSQNYLNVLNLLHLVWINC